jgi:hypothetical protein
VRAELVDDRRTMDLRDPASDEFFISSNEVRDLEMGTGVLET